MNRAGQVVNGQKGLDHLKVAVLGQVMGLGVLLHQALDG